MGRSRGLDIDRGPRRLGDDNVAAKVRSVADREMEFNLASIGEPISVSKLAVLCRESMRIRKQRLNYRMFGAMGRGSTTRIHHQQQTVTSVTSAFGAGVALWVGDKRPRRDLFAPYLQDLRPRQR